MVKEMNIHFSKEQTQIANRHMINHSGSLTVWQMQMEITLRPHLTPVRLTYIQAPQTISAAVGVRRKAPSFKVGGSVG